MPDYQEGKIYKLTCKETGKVYIGSTVQKMCHRMKQHRCETANQTGSRQIIERGNYEVEVIEHFPCDTERQLRSREQYWIDNTEDTTNRQRQYESEEAYLEYNKEIIKKYQKEYRNERKEEHAEYCKKYYLKKKNDFQARKQEVIQCECGGSYTRCHKARHCRTRKHLDNLPA